MSKEAGAPGNGRLSFYYSEELLSFSTQVKWFCFRLAALFTRDKLAARTRLQKIETQLAKLRRLRLQT
ncbi:hypothetical protein Q5741_05845 [Paenibacillus sp. JX-17]|uniref:Uncharacterized protein n=1 Tax=Paenibacillus lacisoli TaxID=3064525 RepID=A0ABT9C9K1_9BACL|nr:hypothetical protein [Paenibacillus sp. JX-17]MDO7905940.1 hypothetical protein [Paenibacillus sp. JX-17]